MTWRIRVASIDVFHKCNQHVVIVIVEMNGFPCLLSSVCANIDYKKRWELWNEVTKLIEQGVL